MMNAILRSMMILGLLYWPILAFAQTYSITQVGGEGTSGLVVNDSGQVAGTIPVGSAPGARQAFITGVNGNGMTFLGTQDGYTTNGPTAINDVGQVTVATAAHGLWNGFVTGPNGVGVNPLPILPSGNEVYPYAINNSGQVTGFSGTQPIVNAFITGPNGVGISNLRILGGIPVGCDGCDLSVGFGINAAGQVTGYSGLDILSGGPAATAFITGPNGVGLRVVPTLGGTSHGLAINASGEITGSANLPSNPSVSHAFLTGPNGEGVIDLGTLPGLTSSEGLAINNQGQVTGISYSSSTPVAFLYSNGKMQNLNLLIDPANPLPATVSLAEGFGITNSGVILAVGDDSATGQNVTFLLTPIGPNTTTTLKVSPTTAPFGAPISLTALVTAVGGKTTPEGTLTFKSEATTLGTVTLNATGQATLTSTSLAVGSDSIVAVYSGSSTFNASTSAAVKVTITAAPVVSFAPSSVAFSSTIVGTVSDDHVVTLKNSGLSPLSIKSIGLKGVQASSFRYISECGSSLAVGKSCLIYVGFAPKKCGSAIATLSVADNAPESPQTVTLTGTGVAPPELTVAPTALVFPPTPVGESSIGQSVTIRNSGTSAVSFTSIDLNGANPADFVTLNNCGANLSAGASCTVFMAFTPMATGKRTATLHVIDDASASPTVVTLSGTGS